MDDESLLLKLTEAILIPAGFEVKCFTSGEAALEAYLSKGPKPFLVITDYVMKGMNGLTLVERCRSIHPSQKALLLSGTVTEDVQKSSRYPANGFLAKPFRAKELVRAVNRLLEPAG